MLSKTSKWVIYRRTNCNDSGQNVNCKLIRDLFSVYYTYELHVRRISIASLSAITNFVSFLVIDLFYVIICSNIFLVAVNPGFSSKWFLSEFNCIKISIVHKLIVLNNNNALYHLYTLITSWYTDFFLYCHVTSFWTNCNRNLTFLCCLLRRI